MLSHTENQSLEQALRAKTKNLSLANAELRFFCRRAAPRQKAPPWGAASQRRGEGACFVAGPPQDKKHPLGGRGQQAKGAAWVFLCAIA
jgi:hypothetical protein